MQFYDTSTLSLANPSGAQPVEIKIPLWASDGSYANGSNTTAAGSAFVCDGASALQGSASSSKNLITLSSKWPSGTLFAFEVTYYSGSSNTTTNIALWDTTSNSMVSASQLSTSSMTATVYRTGQFTLTAGHQYGVTMWETATGYGYNCIDASLIVFPS